MPLKQLLAMRKKQREREAEERQFLQEIGAYVAPARKQRGKRKSDAEYVHKKLFDRSGLADTVGSGDRGLKPSVGKFRDGTLRISSYDTDKVLRPEKVAAQRAARKAALEGSVGVKKHSRSKLGRKIAKQKKKKKKR